MRSERKNLLATIMMVAALICAPGAASAQLVNCGIDYDGNGVPGTGDVTNFIVLWGAGNLLADLNGDGIVDISDGLTFQAYFGFTPCPSMADYQYTRHFDLVDQFFFQTLFSIAHPRADLNEDGAHTAVDVAMFNALFLTTY